MNPEKLRDVVEKAHERVYGSAHTILFRLRLTELGELVGDSLGIAAKQDALAAQQHALVMLQMDKFAQLRTLFEATALWAMIDPQTVEPDQFVANLQLIRIAFPKAFADISLLQQKHTPDGAPIERSRPMETIVFLSRPETPEGEQKKESVAPTNSDMPSNEDSAPSALSSIDQLAELETSEPMLYWRASEILKEQPTYAKELGAIMSEAKSILDKGDRQAALDELAAGRFNATPSLIAYIRNDELLRRIFRGTAAHLQLALDVFVQVFTDANQTSDTVTT